MQTFVPYPNFKKSLQCLDYRRLGKQRVESAQIINTILSGTSGAWSNHPAVNMWRGYVPALVHYYNLNLVEWERRGYKNKKLKIIPIYYNHFKMPWWWGGPIHSSHRAMLLKKSEFYLQYGWSDVGDYVWPV